MIISMVIGAMLIVSLSVSAQASKAGRAEKAEPTQQQRVFDELLKGSENSPEVRMQRLVFERLLVEVDRSEHRIRVAESMRNAMNRPDALDQKREMELQIQQAGADRVRIDRENRQRILNEQAEFERMRKVKTQPRE